MSYQNKRRLPQMWKDISDHKNKMGLIVGRGGCNLKEIQRVTGAKVWVNRDRLYIRGEREQLDAAANAASELIKRVCKSYKQYRSRSVQRRVEPKRKPVKVEIVSENPYDALDESSDESEVDEQSEYPALCATPTRKATWVEPKISQAVMKSEASCPRIRELVRAAKAGEEPNMPERSKKSWADIADEWDEEREAAAAAKPAKKVSWADMMSSDEEDDEEGEGLFLQSY